MELVKRDITVKYRGSVLGIFWSFLNPLLNMIVLTIVFGTFFGGDIPNFPIYVLTGYLIFSFFSAATKLSMTSIKRGAPILKKMYVPKYIYALAAISSETINLFISMIVLALVMIATGFSFSIINLAGIIPIFFLFLFTLGCGLILATVNVFFKDTKYLYGVFTRLLMYACAIFYPITILPEDYSFIFYANPVYCAISGLRDSILYGIFPNTSLLLYLIVISILTLIIGIFVFYKSQDKFILHI